MTAKERGVIQAQPGGEETAREPQKGELLSLKALNGPLELPRDAYYPRLMLRLIWAMEEACGEACRQALLEQTFLSARQDLALSARAGAQRAVMLSSMATRQMSDTENCLCWFALLLEAGSALAQRMEDNPARRAIDFLLPEDADALYRLANLYFLETGQAAQALLCQYPEIMPGRPLAACRRLPRDGVSLPWQEAGLWDEMALLALSAAAWQARAACVQAANRAKEALGRELARETALVAQQHENQLCSLLPRRTALDRLRMAQYMTAYLYDSCGLDETLPGAVRSFAMGEEKCALLRLRRTEALLCRADPSARELPAFPDPLLLRPCKSYVRDAMRGLGDTLEGDRIVPGKAVPPETRSLSQNRWPEDARPPSHRVVQRVIAQTGRDYRFEIARHPVASLRDRARDPLSVSPE